MMKFRTAIFCQLLLVVVLSAACNNKKISEPTDRFDKGIIHVSCDETFKPVIDAQVDVYQADYPDTKIIVHYKPEADCLRDFAVDSIRMIIATRGFTENERAFMIKSLNVGPQKQTVAYDAIALVVNPMAKDSFFTMDQVRDLVAGKLKKNLIPVFDGGKATSTVRFMLDSVLRGQNLGANVVAAQSSEGVIDYVSKTQNAVGFIGVSWVGNQADTTQQSFLRKIRIARVESTDSSGGFVLPVQYLIYTRTYPMVRELVYTLKERHLGLGQAFGNFLESERGQLIFKRAYLQPSITSFYVREAELVE
ncbi:MAG TPA: substrate-binding domain-containing protein [Flavisolibacter sp.]|nr:substrate-binding domain-containing protein [Flavisolibacter sp.]